MSAYMRVALVVVMVVVAALDCVFAAVPKCDPAVTSRMSEFHPKGIPTNIMQSLQKNGVYSYVVVSSAEGKYLGLNVRCIGISIPNASTAQVTYKLWIFPKINLQFPVREDNGILHQTDGQDYKLYVLFMSEAGVIFTYRCCDDCTATGSNVGIAVADTLRDQAATKDALTAAKAKMAELGLDNDVVDLPYCS